jgi:arylsulfatase
MCREGIVRLACLAVVLATASAPSASKPDIVIIMADDMGFSDIGCYGGEIETPNLDRLAAGGLRFTQFYNTARCCPTRASLLTGLYPHQAGVGHMVENRGTPAYQGFLNDRCRTIAEVLRPAGYHTTMVGKWHVGEKRPHWPCDRGFDRYFGLVSGGSNYFRLDKGRQMAMDNEPWTPPAEGFYMTDAFAENAVRFIGEAPKDKPFFLYAAFTSPHWPLHAPPDVIAKYRGKYKDGWDKLRERRHQRMVQLGIVDAKWPMTPRDPKVPAWEEEKRKDEYDLRMAVYAAQIDRMDQGIGRIVAKLRETGRERNTLILFLADNGGCAEIIEQSRNKEAETGTADTFRSYGVGWANASNTPFRLYKHWVHEGGISSPLIAHWPEVIAKGGAITSQPGHLIDLMATCVDLGGAAYPKDATPLEGRSLRPILEGKAWDAGREIFWEHEGNRALRQGKWKLVAKNKGPWELYDVDADRTEMNDLASAEAERAKAMAARHDAWAARVGVQPWK